MSILRDTGFSNYKILGLSPQMILIVVLTGVGLLISKFPRDPIVLLCYAFLIFWGIGQYIWGADPYSCILFLGVLIFSFVVGSAFGNESFLWFQVSAFFYASFIAVAFYYLGFWHISGEGRHSLTGINPNICSLYLANGFVVGLALALKKSGKCRFALLGTLPFFIAPMWNTGSRSGLMALILASSIFLLLRLDTYKLRKKINFGVVGAVILAVVLLGLLYNSNLLSLREENNFSFLARWTINFGYGMSLRSALIMRGIEAFLQHPWIGHGIDAPRAAEWLIYNIGWGMEYYKLGDKAVMTHNGFVDYLIMGGIPLLIVILSLFLRVHFKLLRILLGFSSNNKNIVALAYSLNTMFLVYIFTGDIYSKDGWWLFGFGLQALNINRLSKKMQMPHNNDKTLSVAQ